VGAEALLSSPYLNAVTCIDLGLNEISSKLREALAAELPEAGRDPHGREIPGAAEKTEG